MKLYAIIATCIIASGCASTGVIVSDNESYFIGKKDGMPGLGISLSNKAEVYKEANEFCQAKGMTVITIRVEVIPAIPARLGSTELNFKCGK